MASSDPTPQKRPCRRRHATKVGRHSMQREHLHCPTLLPPLRHIVRSRKQFFFLSNGMIDLRENFIKSRLVVIYYTAGYIEVILQIFFELSFIL